MPYFSNPKEELRDALTEAIETFEDLIETADVYQIYLRLKEIREKLDTEQNWISFLSGVHIKIKT